MERSIRIGKDFNVRWSIKKVVDGERQPYVLAGKELVLQYRTPYGLKEATEWKVVGNTIVWTFRGKEQKALGSYELILTENGGKDGMVTVDTRRAFKLVAHSCEETEGCGCDIVVEDVVLESEVAFAPVVTQGSGSYDDTEIKEEIAELSEAISKAVTPSGDPMHYNYIVVGALYNDTNAPITRIDYFGHSVSHLSGRWYLEGLGDLTNAEMREIYEGGKWWWSVDGIGFASASSARAILPSRAFQQVYYKAGFNFRQAFNACPALEVIDLRTQPTAETLPELNRTKVIRMDFACQGSRNVKYIYGIIDASQQEHSDAFWIHTAGLREVRLYNIKQSVKLPISNNISKASILYMIENEAATNALAITLHADAYARLSADADIVAALAAHPKVSLAKA